MKFAALLVSVFGVFVTIGLVFVGFTDGLDKDHIVGIRYELLIAGLASLAVTVKLAQETLRAFRDPEYIASGRSRFVVRVAIGFLLLFTLASATSENGLSALAALFFGPPLFGLWLVIEFVIKKLRNRHNS